MYAVQIPAAIGDFLRGSGDWEQAAALHRTALAVARRVGDGHGQALALRQLGITTALIPMKRVWSNDRGRRVTHHIGRFYPATEARYFSPALLAEPDRVFIVRRPEPW